ncbi:CXIP4, partial [Symbiodinium sp. KB8]
MEETRPEEDGEEEVPEAHFADADPEVEAAEDIPEPAGEAEPWREEPVNEEAPQPSAAAEELDE